MLVDSSENTVKISVWTKLQTDFDYNIMAACLVTMSDATLNQLKWNEKRREDLQAKNKTGQLSNKIQCEIERFN